MKIVPDAKDGWKWISVQAMALNSAILTTWVALPSDLKETIPDSYIAIGALVVTIAGIVGRFIDQNLS